MKLSEVTIKALISSIGFTPQTGAQNIYFKSYIKHENYILKVDFEANHINYGDKITIGDLTTSHFENGENFVVLECINRLSEKGYLPEHIFLEYKWPMGLKEKGKLDILVNDEKGDAYLMIECKTWGEEFDKERKKMKRDGGQLFSYFQQDKGAKYLCLYTSRLEGDSINYTNDIVKVDSYWKQLNNQKEVYNHWNKNFNDNGIFESWANAYGAEVKALLRGSLRELTADDSGIIFNQFAEILRHNIVSDKPNAFNKILNLFICKIIDEDKNNDEEVDFQWFENDTAKALQKRLNDLYKEGMKRFLNIEVTDYTDKQLNDQLLNINEPEIKQHIQEMFLQLRLQKNPEFAFKEVYNDQSFNDNATVVKEVVELLQPYQFRYGHKQQFLGDFFELLLLSTSIKQEAGQFFTPVPIAKFIVSSFPIKEFIDKQVTANEADVLPIAIDYATGSGHFLTEWMDEVQAVIDKFDTSLLRPTSARKIRSWQQNQFEWAKDFVYGIEADYRLVKTAKVSSFLNGDGEANIIRANGLDNFTKSTDYKSRLKRVTKEDKRENSQFAVLIANPPYSVAAFKNTISHGKESFELYDRLTEESSEIECLFIERAKQLLHPGGWAGIILPSSILGNTGIYTNAREIILKYFYIKAIVEFNSNTFMATGTKTVTLFLERRANSDHQVIQHAIATFFNNPKEYTVNNIENAFFKYVKSSFENIDLEDYISLVQKKPNEKVISQELYQDYKIWFEGLIEVRQLKDKKAFKEKTAIAQKETLEALFYTKLFEKEQNKILYFFLVYTQNSLVIDSGEKQAEKDFIGYKFSDRRGYEGISMARNEDGKLSTKLYDENNILNPEKVNYYIYQSFLGKEFKIDNSLKDNVDQIPLREMLNFKNTAFDKIISLNQKKKIITKSRYELVPFTSIATLEYGGSLPENSRKNGDYPVMGSNGVVGYHNHFLITGPSIIVGRKGSVGKVNYVKENSYPIDTTFYVSFNTTEINIRYFFYFLKSINLEYLSGGIGVPGLNRNLVYELKIPLTPLAVQETIIAEINQIENKEISGLEKIESLKKQMEAIYEKTKGKYLTQKISKHIQIIGGGTPSTKEPTFWNGSIPWLSVADFNNSNRFVYETEKRITEKGLHNSSTKYLNSGDLIISARGTVGAIAQLGIPMTFNQSCYGIRGKNGMSNDYLYYTLKYEIQQLKNNASGAIFDAITTKTFDAIFVPYPNPEEQQQMVTEIGYLEKEIDKIKLILAKINDEKRIILQKHLE